MLSLHPSEDSERNHQHPSTSIVPISLWWLCWILHSDLKSCPLNLAPKKGAGVWSCVWSRKTWCFFRCFPEFSRRRMWVTWWIFILYVHSAKPFFSHVGPGTNQVVTSEIFFFPERRFVAGFFRRLLAYLTPHISHTYLTPHISHTYPSHHTYPTHIHHTTHIPHISIQNVSHRYVSHQYVSHQYVSMQCVSIQNVCISRFCNTYPTNTYPFNTYPTNTYPCYAYPFNAYPFKRCASAGIANVSHQYISHQYVSSTRIPPVRIHSMRIHSKSLHQQEWQWVWVSLHIISYHCYSAGMVMNIETLLFLQFLCKIINWI